MKSELVQHINKKVYRRFPEFTGIRPKVRTQSPPGGAAPTFLLTYETKADVGEGKTLSRWVRVVTDANGKIIKLSTSR